jgi:uncharacterized membrane protein
MITDPVAITLVLTAVVWIAVRLEERFPLFKALGAALVGILLGMVLSNTGILPDTSPAYTFLMGPAVSAGVALILLSVDLRSVREAGPKMLLAFLVGAVGSTIGASFAGFFLSGMIGPETWKLTGQFTGTYIGGGLNFVAIGQALDTSSELFTAAVAADVVVTAVWMMACLSAPILLSKAARQSVRKSPPPQEPSGVGGPRTLEKMLYGTGQSMPIRDAAALVTIAIGAVWGAGALADLVPVLPEVLWLTTIVLAAAQSPAVKRLVGAAMWGNYLILLFLASNGARSVIANIVEVGPAVFYFAMATVAIHGVTIFGVGRLLKIDLPTLAVASQANVGGAASAMAMATARGYADRLLPGVAVGLLGYAVGNYLGFAVAALARGFFGG